MVSTVLSIGSSEAGASSAKSALPRILPNSSPERATSSSSSAALSSTSGSSSADVESSATGSSVRGAAATLLGSDAERVALFFMFSTSVLSPVISLLRFCISAAICFRMSVALLSISSLSSLGCSSVVSIGSSAASRIGATTGISISSFESTGSVRELISSSNESGISSNSALASSAGSSFFSSIIDSTGSTAGVSSTTAFGADFVLSAGASPKETDCPFSSSIESSRESTSKSLSEDAD